MTSDAYAVPTQLPWSAFAGPLERTEDAVARLDERVRHHPLAEGWAERTHFADACAALWLAGALQHAGWVGSLLASALLQTRGKTCHHLAALNIGMRAAPYRQAHFHDLGARIAGFLDGLTAAADRGQKDLDRLTLAREILGVQ